MPSTCLSIAFLLNLQLNLGCVGHVKLTQPFFKTDLVVQIQLYCPSLPTFLILVASYFNPSFLLNDYT